MGAGRLALAARAADPLKQLKVGGSRDVLTT